jgi:hypothetical protein
VKLVLMSPLTIESALCNWVRSQPGANTLELSKRLSTYGPLGMDTPP